MTKKTTEYARELEARETARLSRLTKSKIIKDGMEKGIWGDTYSNYKYLMKDYTKDLLVALLVGRIVRLEMRGY